MLIKGLCDLYDVLEKDGKIVKDGFSEVMIKYLICLSEDGTIKDIISCQKSETIIKGNKEKTIQKPIRMVFPQRPKYTTVKSYIIEHRPDYIFGLKYKKENDCFNLSESKKGNPHKSFIKENLEFVENVNSDIANAYKNFIKKWEPENEINNKLLCKIKNEFNDSAFAFCIYGVPEITLNKDKQIIDEWEKLKNNKNENVEKKVCAIYGIKSNISRIHDAIKGIGGIKAGNLVCNNIESSCSYCNEQSINSSISEKAMNKYTKAMNYVTQNNKITIDDITILYWSIGCGTDSEYILHNLIFGNKDGKISNDEMNGIINESIIKLKGGTLTEDNYKKILDVNFNGEYYIVGIKPNESRLSAKFIYKNKFGTLFKNVLMHQFDIKIVNSYKKPIYLDEICKELISPKSNKESINPTLMSKLLDSIIHGYKYPVELLDNVIRRIKTDNDEPENNKNNVKINSIRVGLVKAFLNRNNRFENKKEEITMGLNEENENQAYLCGRLFAVLQKIQEESVQSKVGKLNKTIKDSYFSKAVSRPVLVFPKLIELAQYHLNNLENDGRKVNFNKLIGFIVSNLNNEFPKYLSLEDQGRFIIGYYQQYQNFFEKNNKDVIEEEE